MSLRWQHTETAATSVLSHNALFVSVCVDGRMFHFIFFRRDFIGEQVETMRSRLFLHFPYRDKMDDLVSHLLEFCIHP